MLDGIEDVELEFSNVEDFKNCSGQSEASREEDEVILASNTETTSSLSPVDSTSTSKSRLRDQITLLNTQLATSCSQLKTYSSTVEVKDFEHQNQLAELTRRLSLVNLKVESARSTNERADALELQAAQLTSRQHQMIDNFVIQAGQLDRLQTLINSVPMDRICLTPVDSRNSVGEKSQLHLIDAMAYSQLTRSKFDYLKDRLTNQGRETIDNCEVDLADQLRLRLHRLVDLFNEVDEYVSMKRLKVPNTPNASDIEFGHQLNTKKCDSNPVLNANNQYHCSTNDQPVPEGDGNSDKKSSTINNKVCSCLHSIVADSRSEVNNLRRQLDNLTVKYQDLLSTSSSQEADLKRQLDQVSRELARYLSIETQLSKWVEVRPKLTSQLVTNRSSQDNGQSDPFRTLDITSVSMPLPYYECTIDSLSHSSNLPSHCYLFIPTLASRRLEQACRLSSQLKQVKRERDDLTRRFRRQQQRIESLQAQLERDRVLVEASNTDGKSTACFIDTLTRRDCQLVSVQGHVDKLTHQLTCLQAEKKQFKCENRRLRRDLKRMLIGRENLSQLRNQLVDMVSKMQQQQNFVSNHV